MAKGGKIGWVLGLLAGTVFGVLFAPRKGKDLRKKMKEEIDTGKLGIAPLGQDLKTFGMELVDIAKDFYESDAIQNAVEIGRKKVKNLSDDLVADFHDFHQSKIKPAVEPLKYEVEKTVDFGVSRLNAMRKKAKAGIRIGGKAVKDIKKAMKKKTHE